MLEADIISVCPENPTETMPAPETDSILPRVVLDVEPVVFPTAEELCALVAGAEKTML